jgi:hypothetical protein
MKKLVALASMAVLLCASASFAKQAMDEEEMDLVTAAGQPSIIDINVTTAGVGEATSSTNTTSTVVSELDSSNQQVFFPSISFVGDVDSNAFAAGAGVGVDLDLNPLLPIDITGSAALNVSFSDANVSGFIHTVASGAVGTLTATASASASSTVTGAVASVTSMNQDSSSVVLLVASGSQSNLRAMVLNNVAGENQLASGINVRAGAEATGEESTQSNKIIQSWGSSYDWTFAEGAIVTASAAGGDATANGGNGTIGEVGKVNCILTSAECGTAQAGGQGGTATAGNGDVDVGVLQHLPLTISADKISRIRVNSTGNAIVDVSEMDSSQISVIVDSDSQTNLAALIVNNIGGRNQVATGINVASSGSVVIGNSADFPLVVFDSLQVGSASYGGGQSNEIFQFRGTPYQQQ